MFLLWGTLTTLPLTGQHQLLYSSAVLVVLNLQTIEDCFYTQHVLYPTRGSATLDLILTTDPHLVSDVQIAPNLGNSDHNMITFTVHDTNMKFQRILDQLETITEATTSKLDLNS